MEDSRKDLLIIKQDYDVIINKISKGLAHTLSEGDTMYLGACRKGQKGDSLMPQHGNEQGAPRRAWSLKTAYMRTVLAEVKRGTRLALIATLNCLMRKRCNVFCARAQMSNGRQYCTDPI